MTLYNHLSSSMSSFGWIGFILYHNGEIQLLQQLSRYKKKNKSDKKMGGCTAAVFQPPLSHVSLKASYTLFLHLWQFMSREDNIHYHPYCSNCDASISINCHECATKRIWHETKKLHYFFLFLNMPWSGRGRVVMWTWNC